jgi:16S rRNA (guanine527-N7)-methyltransferase
VKIDSEQWRQTVIQGALASGVDVSDDQARIMGRHAVELLQWNRTTNLTAITDPLDVAVKHYVDAVAVAPWIDRGARILDAGSGGGFPGIPLCILRPDLSVTLVDSVRKKVSFLKYAIRMLGLTGIDAVHGRLEDLGACLYTAANLTWSFAGHSPRWTISPNWPCLLFLPSAGFWQ